MRIILASACLFFNASSHEKLLLACLPEGFMLILSFAQVVCTLEAVRTKPRLCNAEGTGYHDHHPFTLGLIE